MIRKLRSIPSPSPNMALLSFVCILLALVVIDNVIHEPARQPTAHLVLLAVDFYGDHLSAKISGPGTCKFVPTCSDYMRLAVLRHGSFRGFFMGLWRICRCSPFTDEGGYDYP